MRKYVCLLGLLFLFSLSAAAQDVSKVDLFAGYSYLHTGPGIAVPSFNANGGVGSVALNLTNWGSLVVEVGGVHASTISATDVDATALTYLAGPKITLFHRSKFSPFAQALFGFVNTNPGFNQTTINHNTFAMSPGIRTRLECDAPLWNSSGADGLLAGAHTNLDQPGELEQLPLFRGCCFPFLIFLPMFAYPGALQEGLRRELQGPKHRFLRPFFN